jgi:hypothetical protein
MLDLKKRESLCKLGGLAAAPVLGTFLPAASATAESHLEGNAALNHEGRTTSVHDFDLRIEVLLDGAPRMQVTNTSNRPAVVRQIRPGIVHAGVNAYDLNAAFKHRPYVFEAGETKTFPIVKTDHFAKDGLLPDAKKRQPLRVAMVTADTPAGRLVHSTRAFYA